MTSYPEDYLDDVVENQGKLFDFAAQAFPIKVRKASSLPI